MHGKKAIGLMILAVLLVAGCGSSNSSDTGSSESPEQVTLNKSQYVKQANAICADAVTEKDEAIRKSAEKSAQGKAVEKEAAEAVAVAGLPAIHKMVDELQELGPPPKEQAKINQIVGLYEIALKRAETDPSSLLSGNPFIEADKAAYSYGLEACSA